MTIEHVNKPGAEALISLIKTNCNNKVSAAQTAATSAATDAAQSKTKADQAAVSAAAASASASQAASTVQQSLAVVSAAEKVNATLNGTTLKVTDRNGNVHTAETKGVKGDPGAILYPSFNINSNGHLIATAPTTEADMTITLKDNGHLLITV